MAKPLGYFNLDAQNNQLLNGMSEQWGCDLAQMTDSDRTFLTSRIAHEAWSKEKSGDAPSDSAVAVAEKIGKLSYHDLLNLIAALNQ